jgi:hypothetical protein
MFKALSRTGLEPASPDAGLYFNLSDRDFGYPVRRTIDKARISTDSIRGRELIPCTNYYPFLVSL